MSTKPLDMTPFPELDMPPRILLGPGPSNLDPRVLRAMATPMVGHLDPKFVELMQRTQDLLRYLFQTENKLTYPVSGTGSAAMEVAVANTIEPGDKALACVSGFFGQRMVEMAERYGGDVQVITRPWGEAFSADEVKAALEKRPAKVVYIVHAETSTGVLQPLEAIIKVVHDYDALLVVDAVASLGGVELRVDASDIDICYSGSQKCLSCPPGTSPITFGPRAVKMLEARKSKITSWYFDATTIQKYWGSARTYHHTAPISLNYALYEGLRVVAQEGLENRWQRHLQNAKLLWEGLQAMEMDLLVKDEALRIPALTTVRIPDGMDDGAVRRQLLNDYNIEIAGGFGELAGKVFRIGLMGASSRREYVELLLAALRRIL